MLVKHCVVFHILPSVKAKTAKDLISSERHTSWNIAETMKTEMFA